MELFERRGYFVCNHCGTFHFVDGNAVDGVRVLLRDAAALPCPLCGHTLARSILDDGHAVEHCERCRGLLVQRSTFADVVTLRRARQTGAPVPPAPLDPRELKRTVTCPSCRQRMDVHPYYGPGNVVIDSCSGCNLVWLDHGELRQIGEAPGRDRGAPRRATSPSPATTGASPSGSTAIPRRTSLMDILATLFE